MQRRDFLRYSVAAAGLMAAGCAPPFGASAKKKNRNIVLIFLDDSGWSDFEPFGRKEFETPNVTLLASEGRKFNHFYVPQAVCSASRAALLSGCWPGRTKVFGAHGPNQSCLKREYKIISELLKTRGYKTACFGKWHVGDVDGQRPWDRGFDESGGLLYSNDMWRYHPENPEYWGKFPLRLYENGKVIIDDMTPEDQPHLTTWYTEKAVDFIHRSKKEPFFLYVPHSMPHVPLFVSDKFKDKSGAGIYGDVIMELDWSIGQINSALKECGVERDTLFILTSDNGPWLSYGEHAGQTPYREGKHTSFDGGIRSACIMKYPGVIAAGSCCEDMLGTVDILPTLAALAGASIPNAIDGENVWPLITGNKGTKNPHEYYPFSYRNRLQGVISADGRWKMHLPHDYYKQVEIAKGGIPSKYATGKIGWALFDMLNDPSETMDIKEKYPERFEELKGF
ncbi:MAG: sulfatase-like hydrolase/transferase, partial [Phycisphaerae bacterium]